MENNLIEVTELWGMDSKRAPNEWHKIPEVRAMAPKFDGKKYHERALFKISNCNMNICCWADKSSAYWYRVSEFFVIQGVEEC